MKSTAKSFNSHSFTIASVPLPPRSLPSLLNCLSFLFVFLAIFFHLLFSLSLTLIIGIFYRLNNTFLLLHLITNNLYHIFLFHILFSFISTLIIGIFYCLNYISLLLNLIITHFVIDFITTM